MMRQIAISLSMLLVVQGFLPRLPATTLGPAHSTNLFSTVAVPSVIDGMVGSKLTNNDLAVEAVAKFVKGEFKMKDTSGGVNNVAKVIELADRRKYVLRIYNNSGNRLRVKYEHDILAALRKEDFSFQIPTPLYSLEDPIVTYAPLSNGADACMFEFIPGHLPKLTCVEAIGRASGELFQAITKIKLDQECPTPPYYELYEVHHAADRESFYREMNGPAFDHIREAANEAIKYIEDMEKKLEKYRAADIPMVLMHGDLHYDNVLVQDGKVTGLLDMEFCLLDYPAIELAVCLSKYAGEPDAMIYFKDFITGFTKHGRLTDQDIEMVPDLINLRILSNVIYFVGRHLGKEDDISSITTRLENYLARVKWVEANSQIIIDDIKTKMKAAIAAEGK